MRVAYGLDFWGVAGVLIGAGEQLPLDCGVRHGGEEAQILEALSMIEVACPRHPNTGYAPTRHEPWTLGISPSRAILEGWA